MALQTFENASLIASNCICLAFWPEHDGPKSVRNTRSSHRGGALRVNPS